MNDLFYLGELAANFIEAWICYHFVQLFVPDKVRGKFRFILLSAVLMVTMQAAGQLHVFPFLVTLWFVFYICLTIVMVFRVSVFYAVSLVSFYILCVYIIDFFCLSVMGVLGGNLQFAQMVINSLSLWRCGYLVADKLLLILFYLLVRRALKRELRYSVSLLFTVSLLGSLGVGFLSWLTLQETNLYTLFSWSLCLVLLLGFYFLLVFYSKYAKEKENRLVLQLRDQMIQREYEMMIRQQKEQEELSHDLKNHLLILSTMIDEGRYQEAQNYIDRICDPLEQLNMAVWSGNLTLDVLLNHAKSRAEKQGITFVIQSDAVDIRRMESQDICSLFANLLDNACEAASKLEAGKGWIQVKIRKANDMVFITISNSMAEPPRYRKQKLISSKQDGQLHGLGLNSAQRAAGRYGGELEYHDGDGVFTVEVRFLEGI